MVPEDAEGEASGCHPRPEEQTGSLSPAGRDALTELCLPGESCTDALGITATPGTCPWLPSSTRALHDGGGFWKIFPFPIWADTLADLK